MNVVEPKVTVGVEGFEHVMSFRGVDVAAFKYHPGQVILIGRKAGVPSDHSFMEFAGAEFENKLKGFRNDVIYQNDGGDGGDEGDGHIDGKGN